ncbi:DUF4239 domain-containing protein [Reyranella sp.]|uniref:bestrophin-like domain n=1 Tax=Reyranella sp. TaxID=1929291 RepID=UPI003783A080
MSALTISLIICGMLVGGALTGALLRRVLPDHHLDTHAKDIVRLGCALIATISGLVLGLLINSAKTTYDAQRDEIRQLATSITLLDHMLELYGSEARTARQLMRDAVPTLVDRIWTEGPAKTAEGPFTSSTVGRQAFHAIQTLAPATETQRQYQRQALLAANQILQARLILFEQSTARMPPIFLVVLVFWLCILFASFSLFSPLNPTGFGALVLIALSASGAVFLILEMYQPFTGLMQIDSAPLRQALAPL